MFSLIITIISIALVAALAIATIYYGGSAFTQGSAKAKASTLVAQAQQLNGARALYFNATGNNPTTMGDLTSGGTYLQAEPLPPADVTTGGAWTVNASSFEVDVTSSAVCEKVNETATGTAALPASDPTAQQFACFGASSPYTFRYNG